MRHGHLQVHAGAVKPKAGEIGEGDARSWVESAGAPEGFELS